MPLDPEGAHTAFIGADAPMASPSFSANVAKPAAPAPEPEASPLERTMFMGADYVAPSPASPAAQSPQRPSRPAPALAAPQPPAPARQEKTQAIDPALLGIVPASIPPPAQAPGGLPKLLPSEAPQRELLPSHPAARVPATGQTTINRGGTVVRLGKSSPSGQKMALLGVAGAVVLLSIVALVVVLRGRSTPDATAEATSATASTPAATASATPRPTAAPVVPARTTATAAASAEAEPAAQAKAAPVAGRLPAPARPDPTPEPAAPANPDEGTLVAIAVGGLCAFTVNGAPKGTTSTLKLSLKPGSYSVTCTPLSGASGGSKSRSVTVTGGGTATAVFKL
jgi:serine/threonine-protein kinase